MSTYAHTTVSNSVEVTDPEAVRELLLAYRWPVDLEPKLSSDGMLSIRGYRPLMCYGPANETEDVQQTAALEEFFERLTAYLPPEAEFWVQDIADLNLRSPVHAEEWIVTEDDVTHHELPHSP